MAVLRIALLTALAILAFAGNSLLTRAALAEGEIGPGAFTGLRLVSGAVILFVLASWGREPVLPRLADWGGTLALLVYAVAFTFAYVALGAATGALILFATVQVTMVAVSIARGQSPSGREWLGHAFALAGLVWLLGPQIVAPSRWAAVSMIVAGIAWGAYTLIGRGSRAPLSQTGRYFAGAAPFGLLVALLAPGEAWSETTATGIGLAIASGAVTSGLGYAIWYAALPGLTATVAGIAQLLVPAVAALGAAVWLDETITLTLVLASALVFAGIGVSLTGRTRAQSARSRTPQR